MSSDLILLVDCASILQKSTLIQRNFKVNDGGWIKYKNTIHDQKYVLECLQTFCGYHVNNSYCDLLKKNEVSQDVALLQLVYQYFWAAFDITLPIYDIFIEGHDDIYKELKDFIFCIKKLSDSVLIVKDHYDYFWMGNVSSTERWNYGKEIEFSTYRTYQTWLDIQVDGAHQKSG